VGRQSVNADELICVGHILGAQGVKGWVKIFSNTSPRENILNYSPWLVEWGGKLAEINISGRVQGKNVVAKLDGIDDRDQAENLLGQQLYIKPSQLPRLEADEYYWSDLIGMTVEDLNAEPLGSIKSMMETGADDVMVLGGKPERLIPFALEQVVKKVDLKEKRVVVDWSFEY